MAYKNSAISDIARVFLVSHSRYPIVDVNTVDLYVFIFIFRFYVTISLYYYDVMVP